MATLKQAKVLDLQEGVMFCVPLVDNAGFGFGYVALARKGWGYLYDIFDHVSKIETPPDDIESKPLIIQNLLGNDGQFLEAQYNPDPWRLLDGRVQSIRPVGQALFQIGSKVLDMSSGDEVKDPSIDAKALPYKQYPLDNKYSFLVTAKLLRCDFRFNKEKRAYELVG